MRPSHCIGHFPQMNGASEQKFCLLAIFPPTKPLSALLTIDVTEVVLPSYGSKICIEIREIRRRELDFRQLPSQTLTGPNGHEYIRVEFQISLVFNDINLEFCMEEHNGPMQLTSELVSYRA